jgi:asparagine synthase (glutamine-hydrolysing)
MCGIAGQISFNKPVEPEQLKLMLSALIHRGPDDEGLYITNQESLPSVGLGHRRLSIIDLSPLGHQPMSNEDATVWIVFNGEIYNFKRLRHDLEEKGHVFRSYTDTEVIIHLYEEYDTSCLQLMRGMFAFALWDEREKRLFIARDRVGKKPLYYAETAQGFYFASEINALFDVPSIKRDLDYGALDLYMTNSYIPSPLTILKEVKKLPPAHFLIYENGGIRIERYWELHFTPKLDFSFYEAKRLVQEKLEEATAIRLFSDVPLGCFLSGGVDSSTVVALMSGLSNKPVKTFSIGFAESAFDERPYARTVAERYNTEHHEFLVTPNAVEILPELVRHYGEPFADSSALPTWYLSKMTKEHVTVALNGDGGDELFAGYNWYATGAMLARAAGICPQSVAAIVRYLLGRHPQGSILRKCSRFFDLLGKIPAARFADLRTEIKADFKGKLYSPELAQNLRSAPESYLENSYNQGVGTDDLDRMLYTDTMTYLPEDLMVKVDRATMAHSLEARSPFLDHELMEFVASLPSDFKINKHGSKYILKEAVKDFFPQGFFDRPKMGFSVPLSTWFKGDWNSYVFDKLYRGALKDTSLFNTKVIKEILVESGGNGYNDSSSLIWRLLILAEWFELYG